MTDQNEPVAGPSRVHYELQEVYRGSRTDIDDGHSFSITSNTTREEYIIIELEKQASEMFKQHRSSLFDQMEFKLRNQLEKCYHYRYIFKRQCNPAMEIRFETHAVITLKFLEILEYNRQCGEWIPSFHHQVINFNGVPFNPEVDENELQIIIKTTSLPILGRYYAIAEFEHIPTGYNVLRGIERGLNLVKRKPRDICQLAKFYKCQYDRIDLTDVATYEDLYSEYDHYDKPISFVIETSDRSARRRKHKPVLIKFYQKNECYREDSFLGMVEVKLDDINDHGTTVNKVFLRDFAGKYTGGLAQVITKVRMPLVSRFPRSHEEKMLILI